MNWCNVMEYVIRYDQANDVLYVRVKDDEIFDSEEVYPGVIIDYNRKGEIVGIETLNFSKRKLDLTSLILKGPDALVTKA